VWTFDIAETEVLRDVTVLMGRVESLTAAILRDGDVVDSPTGRRVNPCVAELRQLGTAIARLLGQLELPDEDGQSMPSATTARNRRGAEAQRQQRAEAAGGVSAMASHAAWSRWHREDGA
jgi:hypothetical protein